MVFKKLNGMFVETKLKTEMDIKDFDQKMLSIHTEYETQKRKLIIDYCFSNNPYKRGDVFTDHMGSIIIEKIEAFSSSSGMGCCYFGPELKKDGKPMKNNKKRYAYQSNEVKI